MNKKTFLSIGLIIVLVILVVVGYFVLVRSKEQNVLGPALGMSSFALISACKDWMGLDKMGYLGCLPKNSETKLTIRNNLDKDVRINFENLSTGSTMDTFFAHQEKTIEIGNRSKEMPVRVSTTDNQIISDKQELGLILWKLE
jgi:hypothetical protein